MNLAFLREGETIQGEHNTELTELRTTFNGEMELLESEHHANLRRS